jgi:alpha-tubulin suppressor-like RCC1 family protein
MAERAVLFDFPSTPTVDVIGVSPQSFELKVTPIQLEDAPVEALKLKFRRKDWTEVVSAVLRKLSIVSSEQLELTIEDSTVSFDYVLETAVELTVIEPTEFILKVSALDPGTTYEVVVEAVNCLGSSVPLTWPLTTLSKVYRSLFVWGNNTDDELGFQNEGQEGLTMINQPIRHPDLSSSFAFVTGGRQRSAAISEKGDIVEWGRVVTVNEDNPEQLCEIISTPIYLDVPTPMAFTKLALGANFGLALSVTGQIYSWGFGEYKELGQGDKLFQESPTAILKTNQSKDVRFKDIACGINSCCACSLSGELFEWGFVVQPFNSQPTMIDTPTKLSVFESVLGVRAGGNARVALADDGSVYTWGFNLSGELGHGNRSTVALPRKVDGLTQITDVACGFEHTLFLSQSGEVWACGSGKKGELGLGDCRSYPSPRQISKLSHVKGVSAGLKFSLFLLDSGDVFSCGEGKNSCLGIGVPGKASVPRKVKLTASFVAAGIGHCLALLE